MTGDHTLPDQVADLITQALTAAGDAAGAWLAPNLQAVVDLVRDDWNATQHALHQLDTTELEDAAERVINTAPQPRFAEFAQALHDLEHALNDHRETTA